MGTNLVTTKRVKRRYRFGAIKTSPHLIGLPCDPWPLSPLDRKGNHHAAIPTRFHRALEKKRKSPSASLPWHSLADSFSPRALVKMSLSSDEQVILSMTLFISVYENCPLMGWLNSFSVKLKKTYQSVSRRKQSHKVLRNGLDISRYF